MKGLIAITAALLLTLASVCGALAEPVNSVQTILDDRNLKHDALLHGVPEGYDWAYGPRDGYGLDAASGNFTAFTAWGQVYEAADGNPAQNARVQVRDIRAWLLSKASGEWVSLQATTSVTGTSYEEDFVDNATGEPEIRDESANGGGVSVTVGGGYNFHFWPEGGKRAAIDPNDIDGLLVTFEARLIPDDASMPDDLDSAKLLAGAGGDYWLNLTTDWLPDWTANGDFTIGRMKWVTRDWQAFNACCLADMSVLERNAPPME